MEIRITTIEDINSIAHCYEEYRAFYGQSPAKESTHKFVLNELKSNDSQFLVTIAENKIVGFLRFNTYTFGINFNPIITIIDLYIKPENRREQRSIKLIEELIRISKRKNANWIAVGTSKQNEKATQLYQKLGFNLDKETSLFSYAC